MGIEVGTVYEDEDGDNIKIIYEEDGVYVGVDTDGYEYTAIYTIEGKRMRGLNAADLILPESKRTIMAHFTDSKGFGLVGVVKYPAPLIVMKEGHRKTKAGFSEYYGTYFKLESETEDSATYVEAPTE